MIKERLERFLLDQGVPAQQASAAAERCDRAVTKSARAGFTIGTLIGIATSNPGALVMGVLTGAGASAYQMMASPSCEEVRSAASQMWQDELAGL